LRDNLELLLNYYLSLGLKFNVLFKEGYFFEASAKIRFFSYNVGLAFI